MAGRPKKADVDKKNISIRLRLTQEEHSRLLKCAEKMNITKSEVLLIGLDQVCEDNKIKKDNG